MSKTMSKTKIDAKELRCLELERTTNFFEQDYNFDNDLYSEETPEENYINL